MNRLRKVLGMVLIGVTLASVNVYAKDNTEKTVVIDSKKNNSEKLKMFKNFLSSGESEKIIIIEDSDDFKYANIDYFTSNHIPVSLDGTLSETEAKAIKEGKKPAKRNLDKAAMHHTIIYYKDKSYHVSEVIDVNHEDKSVRTPLSEIKNKAKNLKEKYDTSSTGDVQAMVTPGLIHTYESSKVFYANVYAFGETKYMSVGDYTTRYQLAANATTDGANLVNIGAQSEINPIQHIAYATKYYHEKIWENYSSDKLWAYPSNNTDINSYINKGQQISLSVSYPWGISVGNLTWGGENNVLLSSVGSFTGDSYKLSFTRNNTYGLSNYNRFNSNYSVAYKIFGTAILSLENKMGYGSANNSASEYFVNHTYSIIW
jgi:hypothetical protein